MVNGGTLLLRSVWQSGLDVIPLSCSLLLAMGRAAVSD